MADRKIQAHEWKKLDISPEMARQEREWKRLGSIFQPRDLMLTGIVLPVDCGASEDIKQRVAAIIHPKLPISP